MRALPYSGLSPEKYELIEDEKHHLLIQHMEHLDEHIPLDVLVHGKKFLMNE